jgi:hypothetical protein
MEARRVNNNVLFIIMNALSIIALTIVGLICLWVLSIFVIKKYVDHMSTSKKEKFVVRSRLTRVPQMANSETHDVLAYSLGYS